MFLFLRWKVERTRFATLIIDYAYCFSDSKKQNLEECYIFFKLKNKEHETSDAVLYVFVLTCCAFRADDGSACPSIKHSQEVDGVHMISLPVFGLASYKFKSTVWTPNGGSELQLANSLLQSADNWLRLHHVEHPDYKFFASHGAYRR